MPAQSFDEAIDRRARAMAMLLRIEAWGTEAGQYTACSAIPNYGAGDPLYLPILTEMPRPVSERAPRHGGVPNISAFEAHLLDDLRVIAQLLRTDRGPVSALGADLAAGTTASLTLADTALGAPTVDGVLYIDGEAIRYDSLSGATVSTLTRSFLG